MRRALISPAEKRYDGYRVCQVVDIGQDFPIASPLFWTDCNDDVMADAYWYNPETKECIINPPEVIEEIPQI